MGAQDEFLRNFYILQTDKGVVPLTDPCQIAIYDMLCAGAKRGNDLAEALNLGASTLHFFVDKMIDASIIKKTKLDSDKKSVYYSISSSVIASSKNPDVQFKNISAKTFEDPLKDYNGLSSVANMMDCYMSEIGLDVTPIKSAYVKALAETYEFDGKTIDDAITGVMEVFPMVTGVRLSVFSTNPLAFTLMGNGASSKATLLAEFIAELFEKATRKSYSVSSIEMCGGPNDMVRVVLERADKPNKPYFNKTLRNKNNSTFFVMDIDGSAGIMTSEVQMQIVDAVYERPLCITDIVNNVNAPRSTTTSNLLRMVEEGVLSVFYSESGAAYYGLACSILFKKTREVSSDESDIINTVMSISDKENGFMEGLLLYTLSYLRQLGFDTEYLMVVLGAKYMRAAGTHTPANFDAYFGKMSDIAKTIGLSLNVVSIYPLTIGITTSDPSSEMSHGMTFIKGMAHQGLEMASSGIFVRKTEDAPQKENISFKEIYPALSMEPVKGAWSEGVAVPEKKKRTSSVKTALFNRSLKEGVKKDRSVRYITSIALAVVALAMVLMVVAPAGNEPVDGETFDLYFNDFDVPVYDMNGERIATSGIALGTCVAFSMPDTDSIGFVKNGVGYRMLPDEQGMYSLMMDSDYTVERLYDVSSLEALDCSFSIACGSSEFIPSEVYKELSNGLFVPYDNMIVIKADDGHCISYEDRSSMTSNIPWL